MTIAIGIVFLALGLLLCLMSGKYFFALTGTYLTQLTSSSTHGESQSPTAYIPEPEDEDEDDPVDDESVVEMRHLTTGKRTADYGLEAERRLTVPLLDDVLIERYKWASNIANNIYKQLFPQCESEVGAQLKKAPPGSGFTVTRANQFIPVTWIQVIANDQVLDYYLDQFGLSVEDVCRELAVEIRDCLENYIDPDIYDQYQPRVTVYRSEEMKRSTYTLKFFPLLETVENTALECMGALDFKAAGGQANLPVENGVSYQVANKSYECKYQVPLMPKFAEKVVIGSHEWCHIRTNKTMFDSEVTLRWRPADEPGFEARLDVLDIKGKQKLWLHVPDHQWEKLRKDTYVLIPAAPGPITICGFYTGKGDQHHVGNLMLANTPPDMEALPNTTAFSELFWKRSKAMGFAKYLATRIYLDIKAPDLDEPIAQLDSDEGRDLLARMELVNEDGSYVDEALVTTDKDLSYRVKAILSGEQIKIFRESSGNIRYEDDIRSEVIKVIKEQAPYSELFAEDAKMALTKRGDSPGLYMEVIADDAIGHGKGLVRTMPMMVSERRRLIYGEIRMKKWDRAWDNSGMSCNPKKNFFIEYPRGTIMMRLSRFPVYGIVAPQVNGYISILLESPDGPGKGLLVENQSQTIVRFDNTPIQPGGDASFALRGKLDQALSLEMHNQRISIVIYADPRTEADVREFIPAPGKLSLYGLTLGRREDRAGWPDTDFDKLWQNPPEGIGDLKLRGVAQMTKNGYLASLVRDNTLEEVHFLAGETTWLKTDRNPISIPAQSSTLGRKALTGEVSLWEGDDRRNVIQYSKVDFFANIEKIVNADILLPDPDFYDLWGDTILDQLGADGDFTSVDLLCADPEDLRDFARHLFVVSNDKEQKGWLFSKDKRIQAILPMDKKTPLEFDYERALVGPLDTQRTYTAVWADGRRSYVSFAAPLHRQQVEDYLCDGFFSLKKGNYSRGGGQLSSNLNVFNGAKESYITNNHLQFTHNRKSDNEKVQLAFDPRTLCNYFDKDSFSLRYNEDVQGFTVQSKLHGRAGVTSKTVFMVIPPDRTPVLGSHALPPIPLPPGRNLIILPGLTFEFTQGPLYYGI